MKPIRDIVLVMVIGLLVSGCNPCKRLLRKCPPLIVTDTIIKDTTIYRDSLVLRKIKGDSIFIYDSIYVEAGEVSYVSVTASTELSSARAWVAFNRLNLELIQKDSILEFKIDSAFKSNKHIEYITKTEIHEKVTKPKSFKFFMYGFFSLFVAVILGIVLRKVF